ncbi:MAG: hypothetical protein IJB92_07315, partial [Clostridia bacterium]|nr:hypothetical protein [Clostridia bacterium]
MAENINNNAVNPVDEARQISEQAQIRRDKLSQLQSAGSDPFVITKYDQTHSAPTGSQTSQALRMPRRLASLCRL